MTGDDAFKALAERLHQDVMIDIDRYEDLAATILSSVHERDRMALREQLATALDQLSPAELKGKLNRATSDWRFTTKGADQFLRAVLGLLQPTSEP